LQKLLFIHKQFFHASETVKKFELLNKKKKKNCYMRYVYQSFLRTMMRDAECKPISEESWRFYEIALQDKRRSDFNRLLLRWWIALVCVLVNKIWLHRVLCLARLPFSADVDKVSTITCPLWIMKRYLTG